MTIDLRTLKPFPTWGTPTFDELVTVVDRNGVMFAYRVTVMPDVPQSREPVRARGERR